MSGLLHKITFLGQLPSEVLLGLEVAAQRLEVPRGETVAVEDPESGEFFALGHGRLSLSFQGQQRRIVEPGQCVWRRHLSGSPREMKALRDSLVYRFPRQTILALLREHPCLLETIGTVIHDFDLPKEQPPRPRALALLPLVDNSAEFLERLLHGLGCHGTVAVVDSNTEPEFSRPDDPDVVEKLNQMEESFDTVLYLCHQEPTEWTRRCFRQADLLMLVGDVHQPPPPTSRSETLWISERGPDAPCVLALTHARHDQPFRTALWLNDRDPLRVHHVCQELPEDIWKVTRCLSREGVSLVLGGGGARGLAHIGVLRALQEARLPIDLIGGTSMGALIGAQAALGWNWQRIRENCHYLFVERGSILDYTFPVFSLIRGRKLRDGLREVFGERRIEDLPVPFFAVSTDISEARSIRHEQGLLAQWVGTSMSIPGLAPPTVDGRRILVDGGVLNNVPVDHARAHDLGPVVAVNVETDSRLYADRDPWNEPLWRLILKRFSPFHKLQLPDIYHVLTRIGTMGSTVLRGPQKPELEIRPELSAYGLFDFKRMDEIIEAGYRAALDALEQGEHLWCEVERHH